MSTNDRTNVPWWKRLACWWKGHTYKARDGEFTGTIFHLVNAQRCVRCGISFVDWYNNGRTR